MDCRLSGASVSLTSQILCPPCCYWCRKSKSMKLGWPIMA